MVLEPLSVVAFASLIIDFLWYLDFRCKWSFSPAFSAISSYDGTTTAWRGGFPFFSLSLFISLVLDSAVDDESFMVKNNG